MNEPTMNETNLPPSEERMRVRKKAVNQFLVYEERTTLVKRMIADESAIVAAKTAKLRALRLAKEAADAKAAAENPLPTKKKKTVAAQK